MANLVGYVANVAKSIGYSVQDNFKEFMPNTSEFVQTNAEVFKSVYNDIRHFKITLNRTATTIQNSKVYEAADVGIHAVIEDLKNGTFYNKRRIEEMEKRAMGALGNMEDDEETADILKRLESGDDFSSESLEDDIWSDDDDLDLSVLDDGDKQIVKSNIVGSELVSDTVAKSSKAIIDTTKATNNLMYTQSVRTYDMIQANLDKMNENISSIVALGNVISTNIENTTKYYNDSIQHLQDQTALLRKISETLEGVAKDKEEDGKEEDLSFRKIVNSKGIPNLAKYKKAIKKNIKSKLSNFGMLDAFGEDSNVLLSFVASPFSDAMKSLTKQVIPTQIKRGLNRLDGTFSNFFGALMGKLNYIANIDEDGLSNDKQPSFIAKTLSEIFGLKSDEKSSLETGTYNKGRAFWTGKSERTLNEVIPTYLRKILSAITGKEEKLYDYERGTFVNASRIKQDFESTKKRSISSATEDIAKEFKEFLSNGVKYRSDRDKQNVLDDLKKFLENLYSNEYIDLSNKNKYSDYGISAQNYIMFLEMFKRLDKQTQLKVPGKILRKKSELYETMNNYEKNPDSIYRTLFNESELNEFIKFKTDRYGKETIDEREGDFGVNWLKSSKDDKGNNIFYYLENIYREAYSIRTNITANDTMNRSIQSSNLDNDIIINEDGSQSMNMYIYRKDGKSGNSRIKLSAPSAEEKGKIDNKVFNEDIYKIYTDIKNTKQNPSQAPVSDYYGNNRIQSEYKSKKEFEAAQDSTIKKYLEEYKFEENMITDLSKKLDIRSELRKIKAQERKDAKDDEGKVDPNFVYTTDLDLIADKMQDVGYNFGRFEEEREKIFNAKKKLKESEKNVIDKLLAKKNIFGKLEVMNKWFNKLATKPIKAFDNMVNKIDQRLYEVIFGKPDGDQEKSFMARMGKEIKNSFHRLNKWLDDKVFKKLKEKLNIKSMKELPGKIFESIFNQPFKDVKEKIHDFFFDETDGLFPKIGESVKSVFSGAFENVKESFSNVGESISSLFSPLTDKYKEKKAKEKAEEEAAERLAKRREKQAEKNKNKSNEVVKTAEQLAEEERQRKEIEQNARNKYYTERNNKSYIYNRLGEELGVNLHSGVASENLTDALGQFSNLDSNKKKYIKYIYEQISGNQLKDNEINNLLRDQSLQYMIKKVANRKGKNKKNAIIKLYSDITSKSVNPNDINDARIINKLLLNSELNNAIQQFTKTDNTKEILRNIYTMISGESTVDDEILDIILEDTNFIKKLFKYINKGNINDVKKLFVKYGYISLKNNSIDINSLRNILGIGFDSRENLNITEKDLNDIKLLDLINKAKDKTSLFSILKRYNSDISSMSLSDEVKDKYSDLKFFLDNKATKRRYKLSEEQIQQLKEFIEKNPTKNKITDILNYDNSIKNNYNNYTNIINRLQNILKNKNVDNMSLAELVYGLPVNSNSLNYNRNIRKRRRRRQQMYENLFTESVESPDIFTNNVNDQSTIVKLLSSINKGLYYIIPMIQEKTGFGKTKKIENNKEIYVNDKAEELMKKYKSPVITDENNPNYSESDAKMSLIDNIMKGIWKSISTPIANLQEFRGGGTEGDTFKLGKKAKEYIDSKTGKVKSTGVVSISKGESVTNVKTTENINDAINAIINNNEEQRDIIKEIYMMLSGKDNVDEEQITSMLSDNKVLKALGTAISGGEATRLQSMLITRGYIDKDDYLKAIEPYTADDTLGEASRKALIEAGKSTRRFVDKTYEILFNDKLDEKKFSQATEDISKNIKNYIPGMVGSGILGGGISLLTGMVGGPLVGAAVGASTSLVRNSEKLQNFLFGEKINGDYQGGFFDKSIVNKISKLFPDLKNFGIVGGISGLLPFLPFGPVGGMMLGAGVGFLKNTEFVKENLLGESGENPDNFLKKAMKVLKKAAPVSIATLVPSLMIGPFGFLGNTLLSGALGLLSTTDKFKEFVFGKKSKVTGKYENGLLPSMRDHLINPIKKFMSRAKYTASDWIKKNITDQLKDAIKPMFTQLKVAGKSIVNLIGGALNKVFEHSVGVPFGEFIDKKVIKPASSLVKKLINTALKPIKFAISAPFRILGAAGRSLHRRQVKKGTATGTSAEERLNTWETGIGGKSFFNRPLNTQYKRDKAIANASDEDILLMYDQLSKVLKTEDDYYKEKKNIEREVGNEVGAYFEKRGHIIPGTRKGAKDIAKAFVSGDKDTVNKILRQEKVYKNKDFKDMQETVIKYFDKSLNGQDPKFKSTMKKLEKGLDPKQYKELVEALRNNDVETANRILVKYKEDSDKQFTKLSGFINDKTKEHDIASIGKDVTQNAMETIARDAGKNPIFSGIVSASLQSSNGTVIMRCELYEHPDENSKVLDTLEKGDKVSILGYKDNYYQVKANSKKGFVIREYINRGGKVKVDKKKAKRIFQYLSDELKSRDYTPGSVDDVLENYLDKDKETLSPNELKNRETIESLNKSNDLLANINSAVEVIKAQMLGDKSTMYSLMTNEERERFDKNVLRQAEVSSFKSIKTNAQINKNFNKLSNKYSIKIKKFTLSNEDINKEKFNTYFDDKENKVYFIKETKDSFIKAIRTYTKFGDEVYRCIKFVGGNRNQRLEMAAKANYEYILSEVEYKEENNSTEVVENAIEQQSQNINTEETQISNDEQNLENNLSNNSTSGNNKKIKSKHKKYKEYIENPNLLNQKQAEDLAEQRRIFVEQGQEAAIKFAEKKRKENEKIKQVMEYYNGENESINSNDVVESAQNTIEETYDFNFGNGIRNKYINTRDRLGKSISGLFGNESDSKIKGRIHNAFNSIGNKIMYNKGGRIINFASDGTPLVYKQTGEDDLELDLTDAKTAEYAKRNQLTKEQEVSNNENKEDEIDKEIDTDYKVKKEGIFERILSKVIGGGKKALKVAGLTVGALSGLGAIGYAGEFISEFWDNKFKPWIQDTVKPWFTDKVIPWFKNIIPTIGDYILKGMNKVVEIAYKSTDTIVSNAVDIILKIGPKLIWSLCKKGLSMLPFIGDYFKDDNEKEDISEKSVDSKAEEEIEQVKTDMKGVSNTKTTTSNSTINNLSDYYTKYQNDTDVYDYTLNTNNKNNSTSISSGTITNKYNTSSNSIYNSTSNKYNTSSNKSKDEDISTYTTDDGNVYTVRNNSGLIYGNGNVYNEPLLLYKNTNSLSTPSASDNVRDISSNAVNKSVKAGILGLGGNLPSWLYKKMSFVNLSGTKNPIRMAGRLLQNIAKANTGLASLSYSIPNHIRNTFLRGVNKIPENVTSNAVEKVAENTTSNAVERAVTNTSTEKTSLVKKLFIKVKDFLVKIGKGIANSSIVQALLGKEKSKKVAKALKSFAQKFITKIDSIVKAASQSIIGKAYKAISSHIPSVLVKIGIMAAYFVSGYNDAAEYLDVLNPTGGEKIASGLMNMLMNLPFPGIWVLGLVPTKILMNILEEAVLPVFGTDMKELEERRKIASESTNIYNKAYDTDYSIGDYSKYVINERYSFGDLFGVGEQSDRKKRIEEEKNSASKKVTIETTITAIKSKLQKVFNNSSVQGILVKAIKSDSINFVINKYIDKLESNMWDSKEEYRITPILSNINKYSDSELQEMFIKAYNEASETNTQGLFSNSKLKKYIYRIYNTSPTDKGRQLKINFAVSVSIALILLKILGENCEFVNIEKLMQLIEDNCITVINNEEEDKKSGGFNVIYKAIDTTRNAIVSASNKLYNKDFIGPRENVSNVDLEVSNKPEVKYKDNSDKSTKFTYLRYLNDKQLMDIVDLNNYDKQIKAINKILDEKFPSLTGNSRDSRKQEIINAVNDLKYYKYKYAYSYLSTISDQELMKLAEVSEANRKAAIQNLLRKKYPYNEGLQASKYTEVENAVQKMKAYMSNAGIGGIDANISMYNSTHKNKVNKSSILNKLRNMNKSKLGMGGNITADNVIFDDLTEFPNINTSELTDWINKTASSNSLFKKWGVDGKYLYEVGKSLNIDPRFIATLADAETQFGLTGDGIKNNNPFGYGILENGQNLGGSAQNNKTAIKHYMEKIKKDFFDLGYHSIYALNKNLDGHQYNPYDTWAYTLGSILFNETKPSLGNEEYKEDPWVTNYKIDKDKAMQLIRNNKTGLNSSKIVTTDGSTPTSTTMNNVNYGSAGSDTGSDSTTNNNSANSTETGVSGFLSSIKNMISGISGNIFGDLLDTGTKLTSVLSKSLDTVYGLQNFGYNPDTADIIDISSLQNSGDIALGNGVNAIYNGLNNIGGVDRLTMKTLNSSRPADAWFAKTIKSTKSSNYGWRINPIKSSSSYGEPSWHEGIDYATGSKAGQDVKSPISGKVVYINKATEKDNKNKTGYGNAIGIQDKNGKIHLFGHMLNPVKFKKGDIIKVGDTIGKVGSTGASTGNHLHYGIYDSNMRTGSDIDPNMYLASLKKKGQGGEDIDRVTYFKDKEYKETRENNKKSLGKGGSKIQEVKLDNTTLILLKSIINIMSKEVENTNTLKEIKKILLSKLGNTNKQQSTSSNINNTKNSQLMKSVKKAIGMEGVTVDSDTSMVELLNILASE